MTPNDVTQPSPFSFLPQEIKGQIFSHLGISDIETSVRGVSRECREHANNFQIWQGIANRIGYSIPDDVAKEQYYLSVKNHITDILRRASYFPKELFTEKKAAEKISIENIRETKKRMGEVERESAIIIFKAVQEKIPTVITPDVDTLPVDIDALTNIIQEWMQKNNEQLAKLQNLFLFNKKITHLPEFMKKFTNLKVLDLGHNDLSCIPGWIGEFPHLRELRLDGNRLISLSENIQKLKNLERLEIQNNRFWLTLPKSIAKLPQLRELNLESSFLEEIPDEISNHRHLQINRNGTRFHKSLLCNSPQRTVRSQRIRKKTMSVLKAIFKVITFKL
ncbi:MAG: hypothetical protein K940chlam7_02011 [Chlamydiae bacterium]|nr:hypothetical protein [Chlamydiota bacterium]